MRLTISFLLAIAWLAHVNPAAAHAFLEQASPRVGSAVETSPSELRLRFSEAVEPAFSRITLATKDGAAIVIGEAALDPNDERTLVAAVRGTLAPGVYRVSWRVVSRDTHITTGDFLFAVKSVEH